MCLRRNDDQFLMSFISGQAIAMNHDTANNDLP